MGSATATAKSRAREFPNKRDVNRPTEPQSGAARGQDLRIAGRLPANPRKKTPGRDCRALVHDRITLSEANAEDENPQAASGLVTFSTATVMRSAIGAAASSASFTAMSEILRLSSKAFE